MVHNLREKHEAVIARWQSWGWREVWFCSYSCILILAKLLFCGFLWYLACTLYMSVGISPRAWICLHLGHKWTNTICLLLFWRQQYAQMLAQQQKAALSSQQQQQLAILLQQFQALKMRWASPDLNWILCSSLYVTIITLCQLSVLVKFCHILGWCVLKIVMRI